MRPFIANQTTDSTNIGECNPTSRPISACALDRGNSRSRSRSLNQKLNSSSHNRLDNIAAPHDILSDKHSSVASVFPRNQSYSLVRDVASASEHNLNKTVAASHSAQSLDHLPPIPRRISSTSSAHRHSIASSAEDVDPPPNILSLPRLAASPRVSSATNRPNTLVNPFDEHVRYRQLSMLRAELTNGLRPQPSTSTLDGNGAMVYEQVAARIAQQQEAEERERVEREADEAAQARAAVEAEGHEDGAAGETTLSADRGCAEAENEDAGDGTSDWDSPLAVADEAVRPVETVDVTTEIGVAATSSTLASTIPTLADLSSLASSLSTPLPPSLSVDCLYAAFLRQLPPVAAATTPRARAYVLALQQRLARHADAMQRGHTANTEDDSKALQGDCARDFPAAELPLPPSTHVPAPFPSAAFDTARQPLAPPVPVDAEPLLPPAEHEQRLRTATDAYTHTLTLAMQRYLRDAVQALEADELRRAHALKRRIRDMLRWFHHNEPQIDSTCRQAEDYRALCEGLQREVAQMRAEVAELRRQRLQREMTPAPAADTAASVAPTADAVSSMALLRARLAERKQQLHEKLAQFRQLRTQLAAKRAELETARQEHERRVQRERERVREELELLVEEAKDIQVSRAERKRTLLAAEERAERVNRLRAELAEQCALLRAVSEKARVSAEEKKKETQRIFQYRDDVRARARTAVDRVDALCRDVCQSCRKDTQSALDTVDSARLSFLHGVECATCGVRGREVVLVARTGECVCSDCVRTYTSQGSGARRRARVQAQTSMRASASADAAGTDVFVAGATSMDVKDHTSSQDTGSDGGLLRDHALFQDDYDALTHNPYLDLYLSQPPPPHWLPATDPDDDDDDEWERALLRLGDRASETQILEEVARSRQARKAEALLGYEPYLPEHAPLPVLGIALEQFSAFEGGAKDLLVGAQMTPVIMQAYAAAVRRARDAFVEEEKVRDQ